MKKTFQIVTLLAAGSLATVKPGFGQEIPRQSPNASLNHSPAETAAQLVVREGYSVHLAAAEPEVIDPVSGAWSSDGKLWLVEMPDYPTPRPDQTELHGRIRVLSNRDAEGRFQTITTFAEGLDFATGVLPWRDGAIVTTAGQILFLQDTDGDGQSDSQEVWFKGFTLGNEQLRANHPRLGPDGFVYVAGGLQGGQIAAVSERFEVRPQPLSLQNRDFYFDPRGGDWGTVSGKSQFGLTIDDFNRRIGCSNRNPAIESTLPADLIDRDPYLNDSDGIADVGRAGFESRVSPISSAWTTSNLHAGQFSAACGVFAPGWKDDAGAEWLLVCEPTGSLVQRQSLRLVDGNWQSDREDQPTEWLACADDWFRPVDIVPDFAGAVLVIDMSRAVIEHPHWAPPELQNRPDTWDGNDQGRIWMVSAGETVPPIHAVTSDEAALEAITADDPLVRLLGSSYWYANYSAESLPPGQVLDALAANLSRTTTSASGAARIAWLLNRWGKLTTEQLDGMIANEDAGVRALAVSMRERNRPGGLPRWNVRQLANQLADPALIVRMSALQAIAVSINPVDMNDEVVASLLTVARHDGEQSRIAKLLVSLPGDCASELLEVSFDSSPGVPVAVMEGWMLRAAAQSPERTAAQLAEWVDGHANIVDNDRDAELAMHLAAAWLAGSANKKLAGSELEVLKSLIDPIATSIMVDDSYTVSTRLDAIGWCRTQNPLPTEIRQLIASNQPPELRAAAYRVLMPRDTQWCQEYVVEHADEIPPSDRAAIVSSAQQQTATAVWILDRISQETLPRTFVDPAAMDWFRNHANAEISDLGKQTFAPPGDVAAAMLEYGAALQEIETADVKAGKALFAQHCAGCHQIDGVGHVVGPDISDSRTKTPAALLAAILDPNAGIDASYVTYNVLTLDGEAITGLLAGESSDTVTLQLADAQSRRIDRDEIEIFRPSSVSLMPSGLQRVVSVEQMRDLIGYLKRWRYAASP